MLPVAVDAMGGDHAPDVIVAGARRAVDELGVPVVLVGRPGELGGAAGLEVLPASEVIAKHLRDAIISGQFAEDEPIRQDDIAGLFNVSKIPVREALKRLEAEGLVMF